MPLSSKLTERFHLRIPVIQAPMAGGGDTPALVAAVCNAGGLGSMGCAYLTPEGIRDAAGGVRERTDRPFAVNLFAPEAAKESAVTGERAMARVARYYEELGIAPPPAPKPGADRFAEQFAAALESGAAVFSFTFGIMPADVIAAAKQRGMFVAGTATNVEEAVALEQAGVDAVVAQGAEAGGHRGTFSGDFDAGLVGTMALVPQVVDAVGVPVIASGGIMDGRGIVAALALGASAVQLGTAFLTCSEAGISEAYKEAILNAREHETRLTRAFSGKPARGIVNRFMREMEQEPDILPFPWQNAVTRAMRTEAGKQGRAEFLSLWAGQGVRMAKRQSAAELMRRLEDEAQVVLARLAESAQHEAPNQTEAKIA